MILVYKILRKFSIKFWLICKYSGKLVIISGNYTNLKEINGRKLIGFEFPFFQVMNYANVLQGLIIEAGVSRSINDFVSRSKEATQVCLVLRKTQVQINSVDQAARLPHIEFSSSFWIWQRSFCARSLRYRNWGVIFSSLGVSVKTFHANSGHSFTVPQASASCDDWENSSWKKARTVNLGKKQDPSKFLLFEKYVCSPFRFCCLLFLQLFYCLIKRIWSNQYQWSSTDDENGLILRSVKFYSIDYI